MQFKFNKKEGALENVNFISAMNPIEYYRVSWNIMGTMLAASDSNNQISVWKIKYGEMELISKLHE